MSAWQRVTGEIKTIGLISLYFGTWFGLLALLKRLILAEYHIEFRGLSVAIVGTLVVAKVVAVMEHVSLGRWTRRHPAALDVALRTLLYTLGVFVAIVLERAIDVRHEAGGFLPGVVWVFQHGEIHHALATTIAVGVALLMFNVQSIVRRHLGERQLSRLFFVIPLAEAEARPVRPYDS